MGSTPRQVLFKVRLPLARRMLLLSVNQTILFALSMVVIAGLIGGKGLGDVVTSGLNSYPALALLAGIVIVVMAMALDRVTEAVAERTNPARRHLTDDLQRRLRLASIVTAVAVVATVVARAAPRRRRRLLAAGRRATGCWPGSSRCSTTCRTRTRSLFQITSWIGNHIVQYGLVPLPELPRRDAVAGDAGRDHADRARRQRPPRRDHDVPDARADRLHRRVELRDGHRLAGARRDRAHRRDRVRARRLGGRERRRSPGSCARSTTCCRRCRSSSTSSRSST